MTNKQFSKMIDTLIALLWKANKTSLKDRVVKTDKGYFFDTEAGYYEKLSDLVKDTTGEDITDILGNGYEDYTEFDNPKGGDNK